MNDDPVEAKVGELYVEFFRLRQEKKYQEEYDVMGALMNMLQRDRAHIRATYRVRD